MLVLGADHRVYRNEFCARCNNVNKFQQINIRGACQHHYQNLTNLDQTVLQNAINCIIDIDNGWENKEGAMIVISLG